MLLLTLFQFLPLLQASIISVSQFIEILKEDNYCLPRSAPEGVINHIKKALASAFDEADFYFREQMKLSLIKDRCASEILPLCFYQSILLRDNPNPPLQKLMSTPINFQTEISKQLLLAFNNPNELVPLNKSLAQFQRPLEMLGLLMKLDGNPLISTDQLFDKLLRLCFTKPIATSLKEKSHEELRIRTRLLALELKELILLSQQKLSSNDEPMLEQSNKFVIQLNEENPTVIEISNNIQASNELDEQKTVLRSLILNDYVFPNLQEAMPKDLNHLSLETLNQALIYSLLKLKADQDVVKQASEMINDLPDLKMTCQFIEAIQRPFLPKTGEYLGYGVYAPFDDTITSRVKRIVRGKTKHEAKPSLVGNFKEFKTETCQFNDFMILRELGSGSFGRIFAARHENGKEYALKVFVAEEISRTTIISAKVEEEFLSLLNHPNIGRLHCSMLAPDNAFILVMEIYRGGDLIDFYDKFEGENKEDSIVKHAFQILAALKFLHEMGVAHLDVKPGNMVLDEDGIAYLIDFGISQKIEKNNKFNCLSTSSTTPTIQSPEQTLPNKYPRGFGVSVDLFGLGISLYYMATTKGPYNKEEINHCEFTKGLVNGKKIPSTGLGKIDELISLLTNVDPVKRYDEIFGGNGYYYAYSKDKFIK